MTLFLNPEIDAQLQKEGYTREMIRSIQHMRKEMGLNEKQQISVNIVASGKFIDMLDGPEIRRRTNAKELMLSNAPVFKGLKKDLKVDEFDIAVVIITGSI
jgi:hypothetical protein